MSKSERIFDIIRKMGMRIPPCAYIKRTYAGIRQKQRGGLSWYVMNGHFDLYIGSFEPITELLKCPNLIKVSRASADYTVVLKCGCDNQGCLGLKKLKRKA